MKILVVGSGGREHALAWKLSQSALAEIVFVAPGNAGTALEPGILNVDIGVDDTAGLMAFATSEGVDLTVIGPEAPLVDGIVDSFREAGLLVFGPIAKAAQLEGSKVFTKDFLARHGIASAAYAEFSEVSAAHSYIEAQGAPIVVKADGLAAGKGVVVATTVEQAKAAVNDMLEHAAFGESGARVVIEEFMAGEEVSFICIVGGGRILPLASSQDHKAAYDGDTGPNTGGMGAYSPAPIVDDAMHERIMRDVIEPTVRGLSAEGIDYEGFLYAGLMIGADGVPRVVEYNCRFGDPEAQPVMLRLRGDLVELCTAALDGSLPEQTQWDPGVALGVVVAAKGYPGSYAKGEVIKGTQEHIPDTKVFHSGTALQADELVSAGGRVLCVCGLGQSVSEAQRRAYERVAAIDWPGSEYRTDIGYRAVAREQAAAAG
jgi:phosphoribosylamine--glycine ligase